MRSKTYYGRKASCIIVRTEEVIRDFYIFLPQTKIKHGATINDVLVMNFSLCDPAIVSKSVTEQLLVLPFIFTPRTV